MLACWSTVTITFGGIEAELARGGVEDALVGLVRHEPVDLVGRVARGVEHLVEHVGEVDDRVAEHLACPFMRSLPTVPVVEAPPST